MHTTSATPDLLPPPSPGRHLDPADGACLMEAASLLAGEPFSDHPRCVHPTLAALARVLNDATTAAGRVALWPLLPDLIDAPAREARIAPAVVLQVLAFTQTRCDIGTAGRLARRRAVGRLARLDRGGVAERWIRASDALYRRTTERLLCRSLTHVLKASPAGSIDHEAPRLLARCLGPWTGDARALGRSAADAVAQMQHSAPHSRRGRP